MNSQPRGREQALAILALATAIVGFGVFGGDLFEQGVVSNVISKDLASDVGLVRVVKRLCGLAILVHYLLVFVAVRAIFMRDEEATGRQIADGALSHTFWQMLYLALVFVLDLTEDSLLNSQARGMS